MLTVDAARKIGINACIDALGRDFVLAHKDCAASAYSAEAWDVFCFVGVDDRRTSQNQDDLLILDSQSVFPYRASCNVSLENGAVRSLACVLPNVGSF